MHNLRFVSRSFHWEINMWHVSFRVWVISFNMVFPCSIILFINFMISLLTAVVFQSVYVPQFYCPLINWRIFILFLHFTIVKIAAMNMTEEMSVVSDCESDGYNSRSGTTESYGRLNFSFLWVLYNDFHSDFTSLQFQQRNFVAQKNRAERVQRSH